MSKLFLSVLNMSIAASWLVLAVLLLRLALKKAPKWLTVALWAVVAVRLICPVSIESEVSLIPSAQTIPPSIMTDAVPEIHTGIYAVNSVVNPVLQESFTPTVGESANSLQLWISVAAVVWGVGLLAMLAYAAVSYLRVKRRVRTAVLLRENLYQSENVASPFVLGLFQPRVYLPFDVDSTDLSHVIAHEQAHIRRKDHWWKPVGFAILALHWFNPLMWLGYVLLCRDIELACDEKVVKTLDAEKRADYSQALLHCSVGRRMIAACPLAFGEVSVKDRVKSVLSYKEPAFWILVVGIVASIVLAICFLTNPTPGNLGTLENLEFISLTDRTESTACVWVSDGFSYERVGAISEDLLRDLANIKTSKEEISLNRSEDRDKSHTIVLQTQEQAGPSLNSYLEGLYIHFNSDFTAVWINNNVKPTLTYKVMEPQKAKEVYGYIASYNVREPAIQIPTISLDATDIESLKAKFPMYFDLGTFKGLEVYIWQMAEHSYSCGVLQGVNRNYTQEEIWDLHKNPASLDEMRAIIAYYLEEGLAVKEDITLVPVTMPHSSYYYEINDAYKAKLNELFWSSAILPTDEPFYYYSPVIDEASFDIDGDGKEEHCVLRHGPTSGLFTFTFSAFEDAELEYFNIFTCPWTTLSFGATEEGQGILIRKDTDWESLLTVSVENGNIVIFSDKQDITYWGEQGLDSPFASIATQKIGSLQTIEGNFRTYYANSDGTWQYNGYIYKYRLVITGRMPNAVADTTYVYLSNLEEISFERAMWASGLSSSLNQYFPIEEAILVEISTAESSVFTKAENGNLISPSGVEYAHLANEGFLYYLGELEFVGSVQGEEASSQHLGATYQTGMFAIKNSGNDNILIRISPNSEWFSIYRKASLATFDYSADNCVRFELILLTFPLSDIHTTCKGGISDKTEIANFLSDVRSQKDPHAAGLYALVTKPDGFLENCYGYGCILGFFEDEPNLAIKMNVTSFNDLGYSVSYVDKEYVLPGSWLWKLQYTKCTP